jgi:hypothetical protein
MAHNKARATRAPQAAPAKAAPQKTALVVAAPQAAPTTTPATAHMVASRKAGIDFMQGAATLQLTPYGLTAANPWGQNSAGHQVYVWLKAQGAKGATIGALEAAVKAGKVVLRGANGSTNKCTVRDHVRYLYTWGGGPTAYLAINGKANGQLPYKVRPAG